MKLFEIKKFLKHKIVLQWNILAMWDENFSTENRDNSPLPSINCSSLPKTLWNTGWFPGESFRSFEVKEIFDKTLRLPPPLCLKFCDTRILSKHRSVLLRVLSALRDNKFSTEFSGITLCIHFRDTRTFLKHRIVPQRKYSILCDEKLFDGEMWYPLSLSLWFI